MALKDTLRSDLTAALKARDSLTVTVLRSAIGAIQSAEKAGKIAVDFDDEAVVAVLREQLKLRKESAMSFAEVGRPERAQLELDEAKVLESYIPTPLSADELQRLVISVVRRYNSPTKREFGIIRAAVLAEAGGRAVGADVSAVLKNILT